jgi:hypothetical protein
MSGEEAHDGGEGDEGDDNEDGSGCSQNNNNNKTRCDTGHLRGPVRKGKGKKKDREI